MSANPSRQIITGVGTPRVMADMPVVIWTSAAGTTTFGVDYVQDTAGISTSVLPGMRIAGTLRINSGGLDYDYRCYAKVESLDVPANRYYVDEWVGGTPTNGIAAVVDGWIADLPRTLERGLSEFFDPIVTIHRKYRNVKGVKKWGFEYSALLDYEKRFTPDHFYELRYLLQQSLDGVVDTTIFIPRKDKPGFNYPVYMDDAIEIALHGGQTFHRGVRFKFQGRLPVASVPHSQFGGYGMNYGQQYGIGL